jgi:hypothetical protein
MDREEFLKRFKHGSEAWKILISMSIAKQKAVNEKIEMATGLTLYNLDPS